MRKVSCSVAIFGGGPAGIAAGVTASRAGLSTVVIDEGIAPGGQIWRGSTARSGGQAGRWLTALAQSPLEMWSRTRVVTHSEPGTVILESPRGPLCLHYNTPWCVPVRANFFSHFLVGLCPASVALADYRP